MIDLFGAVAVSCMALFYALEQRAPIFILLFAGACLASSGYAVAIRSWPFAAIEFLWAGIALWRWIHTPSVPKGEPHDDHDSNGCAPDVQPPD